MVAALRIAPFGRLLATYTLDEAADWLIGISLAVFVYGRTESALAVAALLMATRFGPSFVIAPMSGRLGAWRLGAALSTLYLGAAVIACVLAAIATGPLPLLYVLTFFASLLAATGRVLTRTAGCNLLDEHGKLRDGAAAMNVSSGAINVLGPMLAGAVTILAGSQVSVLAAAVIFAALAAVTFRLGGTAQGSDEDATEPVGFRAAVRLLSSTPSVAAILLAATILLVLVCMDEPVLIPYIEQSLGGGTAAYAGLLTFWSVGMLLGGLAFIVLRRWSMLGSFVLAGMLFAGSYIGLGLAHTLPAAYAVAVLGGMGNGMFWATITVVTLEAVPPSVRAQTSGVTESLAMATPGIGYIVGGVLSEVVSPAQVYLLAGTLGVSVVAALTVGLARPWQHLASARTALPTVTPLPSTTDGR